MKPLSPLTNLVLFAVWFVAGGLLLRLSTLWSSLLTAPLVALMLVVHVGVGRGTQSEDRARMFPMPPASWWTAAWVVAAAAFLAASMYAKGATVLAAGGEVSLDEPGRSILAAAPVSLVFAPVAHELLLRGWLVSRVRSAWGQWPAILVSALGSSVLSFYPVTLGPSLIFPHFVLGLSAGIVLVASRSIWMPILFHVSYNAFALGLWSQNAKIVGEGPLSMTVAVTATAVAVLLWALVLRYGWLQGIRSGAETRSTTA
jgi:membrane protease YdiL (CAAX protease family)